VIAGLGRRYARALLALARAEGRLGETGEELARLSAAFADQGLQQVLENPAVGADTRDRLADRVATAVGVSKTVGNAIRLLARRDRLAIVGDVDRAYRALLDGELGRTRVVIRSAAALSATEVEQLEGLARRLAQQDVMVASEVDPDLIGGAVLDVGGVVYDGSIKTQLTRMAHAMTLGSR
jgi:F-type H+-transporting ATPase subunit delta